MVPPTTARGPDDGLSLSSAKPATYRPAGTDASGTGVNGSSRSSSWRVSASVQTAPVGRSYSRIADAVDPSRVPAALRQAKADDRLARSWCPAGETTHP